MKRGNLEGQALTLKSAECRLCALILAELLCLSVPLGEQWTLTKFPLALD